MMNKRDKIAAIAAYTAAAVGSLALLAWLIRLWKARLGVPFGYHGDALYYVTMVKGMIDDGWYLTNRHLGAPGILEMHDFVNMDGLHYFLLKILSWMTKDPAAAVNLYFIMGFPAVTLTGLYALRRCGVSWPTAVAAALLYAFLPYHFVRNVGHLFLSGYYLVPLIVLVVLWMMDGELVFWRRNESTGRLDLTLKGSRNLMGIVVFFLMGSSGVYYACFSCLILIVGAVWRWAASRRRLVLADAGVLLGAVLISASLNAWPAAIHKLRHGKTSRSIQRKSGEGEVFGLKISQMLLPVDHHRIKRLAGLKRRYNENAPLVNENRSATLGFVGGIGFLILMGWILMRWRSRRSSGSDGEGDESERYRSQLDSLSLLNLSCVLYGCIGGFGPLFSFFFPMMRSHNRISIFIAFFSILTAAILADRLFRKMADSRWSAVLFHSFLVVVLVAGILDQTDTRTKSMFHYSNNLDRYRQDRELVGRMEAVLPKGAMVFQLPQSPFPESISVEAMPVYDQFRGYLYSSRLRWSHGAMKGSRTDAWQSETVKKPAALFVREIILAGFSGIMLFRAALPRRFDVETLATKGFPERGNGIEGKLSSVLETEGMVSRDKSIVFFDLLRYEEKLKRRYTKEEWEKMRREVRRRSGYVRGD